MSKPDQSRLERFLSDIPTHAWASELSQALHISASDVERALVSLMNEARITWQMIAHLVSPDMRIIEIGAGLCLTSLFLKSEGLNVVALEPASGGFDLFRLMRERLLDRHASLDLEVLECPAQELDPARHGQFDFIFSNNVIEHIPDWSRAMDAMLAVLSPYGCMRHACPNYRIPYEPHFGLPVLGPRGRWTRRWFASSIEGLDAPWVADGVALWNSLNFISAGDVLHYARQRGLDVEFEPELLYRSLRRLEQDPWFRRRHEGSGLMGCYRLLKASGMLSLLRRMPATWTTPMTFTLRRAEG